MKAGCYKAVRLLIALPSFTCHKAKYKHMAPDTASRRKPSRRPGCVGCSGSATEHRRTHTEQPPAQPPNSPKWENQQLPCTGTAVSLCPTSCHSTTPWITFTSESCCSWCLPALRASGSPSPGHTCDIVQDFTDTHYSPLQILFSSLNCPGLATQSLHLSHSMQVMISFLAFLVLWFVPPPSSSAVLFKMRSGHNTVCEMQVSHRYT